MSTASPSIRATDRLLRSALALCMLLGAGMVGRAADSYSEDAVKAAFVLRFAGYVEWPAGQIPDSRFTIAVLGANDVALRLQTLAADRTLQNRPVQVRRIASIHEAREAQILYVGRDRPSDLRGLLAPLAGRSILVISDTDMALAAGSTINFLTVDKRVRFEVSVPAARRARLRISAELLSVAARVQQ